MNRWFDHSDGGNPHTYDGVLAQAALRADGGIRGGPVEGGGQARAGVALGGGVAHAAEPAGKSVGVDDHDGDDGTGRHAAERRVSGGVSVAAPALGTVLHVEPLPVTRHVTAAVTPSGLGCCVTAS